MIILCCVLIVLILLFILVYTHRTYIFFTNNHVENLSTMALAKIKSVSAMQHLYQQYGEGRVNRVLNLCLKEAKKLPIDFNYCLQYTTSSYSVVERSLVKLLLQLLIEDVKEELKRRYPRIK